MAGSEWSRTASGRRARLVVKGGFAFFWGQWPSNWEPSPFVLEGVRYSCVEQWMMSEKARLFGDERTRQAILKARSPARQKALGRAVRGFDERRWARHRYSIVLAGTVAKYAQNPDLRRLLFATGNLLFVEASPEDPIWGIGMGTDDPNLLDRRRWGQNLLGLAITEARSILRSRR